MVTCGNVKTTWKVQVFYRLSPESYELHVSGRSSDLFNLTTAFPFRWSE
ncbi:hypothetical protein CLV25_11735 [Acetobacteroides hydrogenigenes]|uniref:Uncharacterized protein n=1 Tax=Acetobacteroides hydrogenigenes TaxID=979970 RepID=A0A4V2RNA6_9BACT|nr:hypothetical protein CLV25_11735 [Acetobacteroides hydrogenigenes]